MTFRIDLQKIYYEIHSVDKTYSKIKTPVDITGMSRETVASWRRKEAPAIVELIYWNSKEFNHSIVELIKNRTDKFPVLKLLMYYHNKTESPIESVIIIDKL
jgi:transcriptional regulator with XRE-family HTH domain